MTWKRKRWSFTTSRPTSAKHATSPPSIRRSSRSSTSISNRPARSRSCGRLKGTSSPDSGQPRFRSAEAKVNERRCTGKRSAAPGQSPLARAPMQPRKGSIEVTSLLTLFEAEESGGSVHLMKVKRKFVGRQSASRRLSRGVHEHRAHIITLTSRPVGPSTTAPSTLSAAAAADPTFTPGDNILSWEPFPNIELPQRRRLCSLDDDIHTWQRRRRTAGANAFNTQLRVGLFDGPDGAVVATRRSQISVFIIEYQTRRPAD